MAETQSFANHAKMVPLYHYVIGPLAMASVVYFGSRAFGDFSIPNLFTLFLAVALLLTAFFARVFALGVQDRLIRLEEQMRMAELLPEALKPRVREFTTEQLIALRFASDQELPELASRVLDEGMSKRKDIKQAIKTWRADNERI